MEFYRAFTASGMVEAVNVLGNQGQVREKVFELNQGVMAGVRPGFGDKLPSPGVPFPD